MKGEKKRKKENTQTKKGNMTIIHRVKLTKFENIKNPQNYSLCLGYIARQEDNEVHIIRCKVYNKK